MAQQLLSAVKEDDVETKRLCAQQLPYFYSQYPKLQYPIANAIYDLCEDSSSKVTFTSLIYYVIDYQT